TRDRHSRDGPGFETRRAPRYCRHPPHSCLPEGSSVAEMGRDSSLATQLLYLCHTDTRAPRNEARRSCLIFSKIYSLICIETWSAWCYEKFAVKAFTT